ncbi:hypothetical protein, partial [Microcystis aeruginosa]|uniref:hypothetical protein n=1 Tax=Microcystis aeruginosa TaxID=1126 RepID=UPI0013307B4E
MAILAVALRVKPLGITVNGGDHTHQTLESSICMALRFKLIKVEKADPAITVLTEKSILADSDGAAVHFVQ